MRIRTNTNFIYQIQLDTQTIQIRKHTQNKGRTNLEFGRNNQIQNIGKHLHLVDLCIAQRAFDPLPLVGHKGILGNSNQEKTVYCLFRL